LQLIHQAAKLLPGRGEFLQTLADKVSWFHEGVSQWLVLSLPVIRDSPAGL
jgi:hypothetical protein